MGGGTRHGDFAIFSIVQSFERKGEGGKVVSLIRERIVSVVSKFKLALEES